MTTKKLPQIEVWFQEGSWHFETYEAREVSELGKKEEDRSKPPCLECGAMTSVEAETKCICSGDKDDCHGCELWED